MTTVGTLVEEVRSLLQGTMPDELSVLDGDYNPGDGRLVLRYPKPNLQVGSLVSAGLGTFYVLAVDSAGRTLTVHPQVDGGPDVAVPSTTIVRMRPQYTDWSIFREWNGEAASLSSPLNGLYAYNQFTAITDYVAGIYPLPSPQWDGQTPVRLLGARYQHQVTLSWQRTSAEYQPDTREVRVYGDQPTALQFEFIFAFPFGQATALSTDPSTLGFTEHTWDIPGLGAAANLTRGGEARRNQLAAQGDPRRAQEVPPGAQIGVSRAFAQIQEQRIAEERTRLQAEIPPWQSPIGVQPWAVSRDRL